MTKEKMDSLKKYILEMKGKLEAALLEKHKDHKKSYHEFLISEIRKTQYKIDEAAIAGTK